MPIQDKTMNNMIAMFGAKTAYSTYSSEREHYQKTQQPGYKGPSYADDLLLGRVPTELVQPENIAMELGIGGAGVGLGFLLKKYGPNALKSIKNILGRTPNSADDLARSQSNLNRAQLQQPKDFPDVKPSYNDYINDLKSGKGSLKDYQNLDDRSQRLVFKDGKVIKQAQASNRADYSGLPQNKFGGYEGRVSDKHLPDGQNYVYDNKDIYGSPKEQYITSNMYDKQPGYEKPYLFDDNMNYKDIDGDKLIFNNQNRNPQRSGGDTGGMSQYDLDNQSLVSDQIDNTDMMSMNDFRRQYSRQQLDDATSKGNLTFTQQLDNAMNDSNVGFNKKLDEAMSKSRVDFNQKLDEAMSESNLRFRKKLDDAMNKNTDAEDIFLYSDDNLGKPGLTKRQRQNSIDVGQGNRVDIDELAEQLTDMDMYSESQAIKRRPFDPESQYLNEGPSLDPNNAGYDPDMVRSEFLSMNKNDLLIQKTSHGKAKTAVTGEKSFNDLSKQFVDDFPNFVKQTQGDRLKASADNILSEFERIFGKKRAK